VKGKILDWKDDRGFGFIESESGTRVFFHISDLSRSAPRPALGTLVYYDLAKGKEGKLRATNVVPFDLKVQKRTPPRAHSTGSGTSKRVALIIISVLVFPFLWWLVNVRRVPPELLWAFCVMSSVTFVIYGMDKSAAKHDAQRVPEKTLQMLSLLCGWPGGLLAQQVFRHKSKKASFQFAFWSTVFFNVLALFFLFSKAGVSLAG